MMPILVRELVENRPWATVEELLDYYAISQCTPGIIAVNVATFIGNKRKGIIGGIVATLGMVTPSIVIMSILAFLINKGIELKGVAHAFAGIRIVAIALILNTVMIMWKHSLKEKFSYIILAMVICLSIFLKVSPVWIVLISALFGTVYSVYVKGRVER